MQQMQGDADWQSAVTAGFSGIRSWQAPLDAVIRVLKEFPVLPSADICRLSCWLEPLLVCLPDYLSLSVCVMPVCSSAFSHLSSVCLCYLAICLPAHVCLAVHVFVCLCVNCCLSPYALKQTGDRKSRKYRQTNKQPEICQTYCQTYFCLFVVLSVIPTCPITCLFPQPVGLPGKASSWHM